jgi:hypothetical protein
MTMYNVQELEEFEYSQNIHDEYRAVMIASGGGDTAETLRGEEEAMHEFYYAEYLEGLAAAMAFVGPLQPDDDIPY